MKLLPPNILNSRPPAQMRGEPARSACLEAGKEFEDFLVERLAPYGLSPHNFTSRKYQGERGENLQGWEIKYDRLYHDSGNLFIATASRQDVDREYHDSGIMGGCWLFFIGDEKSVFIFTTRLLRRLTKLRNTDGAFRYPIREIGLKTSMGFKLPIEDAEENDYLERRIDF